MKYRISLKSFLLGVFAIAFTGLNSSCVTGQVVEVPNNSNGKVVGDESKLIIKPITSSDGSRVFVREEGWPILDLSSGKKTKFKEVAETKDGQRIKVDVTSFHLAPFVVTDEPFASIGDKMGKVEIGAVLEFKARNRVFCYKFQVNRVTVYENTNTVRSSSGSVFFYAYYDEDGDGKFESLVLDEIGRSGYSSIANPPHVPKWVLQ